MTEGRDTWHLDAVIYQLHVRTFADSNGDGIGDFRGLIARLDYLAGLGITCLWLMPFCESPLRDDGYDVSHYERIHAPYGTMEDFQAFLDAAHARGMRVITELVINHTSDRHAWFEAARHAPAGSAKRNFYVWSDSTDRYAGARVIFCDVEPSNWTWDPIAGAYYWHRFFSHQPDLNFDNPHVRHAVLKVMRFWLDKGATGCDWTPWRISLNGRAPTARTCRTHTRSCGTCGPRWTNATADGFCSRKSTRLRSGCANTSATATNATWRFTFH